MRIGVVGLGIVGGTVKTGMEELGFDVVGHDKKLQTALSDVLETEICYICVPTPANDDGSCNTEIVESVVAELNKLDYIGLIAIKSTVAPGTTKKLSKKYRRSRFAFVPEFLRERCAIADFTENHDVCIIGTNSDEDYRLIKKSHGHYPRKFVRTTPCEAELSKYFNNIYNATLVTFANSFYEVCKAQKVDYSVVKNSIVNRDHINDTYLDCNKNFRGFGGVCLPKDTSAIAHFCEFANLDVQFFKDILKENSKYKVTVPTGMREA